MCVAAVLAMACATAPPPQKTASNDKPLVQRTATYMPRLTEPNLPVGAQFFAEVEITHFFIRQLQRDPDQEPKGRGGSFTATARVEERLLEVLSDGSPKALTATLHDLEIKAGKNEDARSDSLSGVPLTVVLWPKKRVERTDGVELTGMQKALVDNLYTTTDPDEHSMDTVYGPRSPVEVGESWSMDAETMRENFARANRAQFQLFNLAGEMTLKEVKTIEGVEYLHVVGKGQAEFSEVTGMDDASGGVVFAVDGDFRVTGVPHCLNRTIKHRMAVQGRVEAGLIRIETGVSKEFKNIRVVLPASSETKKQTEPSKAEPKAPPKKSD